MTTQDMSIPVLPSRSLTRTIAFYQRLGFEGELLAAGTYAILTRGALELHFFPHPDLVPAECYAGAYLRVAAVDPLHVALLSAGLPTLGIPRMEPVEDKPWGMREFALIDEDGNLVKFGQVIDEGPAA
jgi:catechol 2,3-dioxygenase-like lactoylglutathione lyase family enzyme